MLHRRQFVSGGTNLRPLRANPLLQGTPEKLRFSGPFGLRLPLS
jgi:hypothetical protein